VAHGTLPTNISAGGFKIKKTTKARPKKDNYLERRRATQTKSAKSINRVKDVPTPYQNLKEGNLQGIMNSMDHQSVKSIIEKIVSKDNNYVRQYEKEDYLTSNDFIFNLNKTHKLELSQITTNHH